MIDPIVEWVTKDLTWGWRGLRRLTLPGHPRGEPARGERPAGQAARHVLSRFPFAGLLGGPPSGAPPHGADRQERPGRHSGRGGHRPHASRRAGSGHADDPDRPHAARRPGQTSTRAEDRRPSTNSARDQPPAEAIRPPPSGAGRPAGRPPAKSPLGLRQPPATAGMIESSSPSLIGVFPAWRNRMSSSLTQTLRKPRTSPRSSRSRSLSPGN